MLNRDIEWGNEQESNNLHALFLPIDFRTKRAEKVDVPRVFFCSIARGLLRLALIDLPCLLDLHVRGRDLLVVDSLLFLGKL